MIYLFSLDLDSPALKMKSLNNLLGSFPARNPQNIPSLAVFLELSDDFVIVKFINYYVDFKEYLYVLTFYVFIFI